MNIYIYINLKNKLIQKNRNTTCYTETPGEAPGGLGGRRKTGESIVFMRVLAGRNGQGKVGLLSNFRIGEFE